MLLGDFICYRKPLYDVNLRMSNLGFVKELAFSTLPKSTRVYICGDIMPLVLQQDPQKMTKSHLIDLR